MAAAMMTVAGVRVIDEPERCVACGKFRPYQDKLCWRCGEDVAQIEAEYLKLTIENLMTYLSNDHSEQSEETTGGTQ